MSDGAPPLKRALLLRRLRGGFELVDPTDKTTVASGLASLAEVVLVAGRLGATSVWQQALDERGRPIGLPFELKVRGLKSLREHQRSST